ncbi:MAG: nuclear transport factor 2 family protein [Geminicoccaceae bacterium]
MWKTLLACLLLMAGTAAAAEPAVEVRALYERFAAAQNAHDLAAVRPLLLDSPTFLWVSDGQSFWGVDAVLARMASFQKAEIWRVEPDLARAVPIVVSPGVAYLHLPLVLVIGRANQPDRLRFLVSMLGVDRGQGWKIAALFTATQKVP